MDDQQKAKILATLTPEQLRVTQACGTEPPFQNAYWDSKEPGIYVDLVSGEPLFSSLHKFDSGSGWPSFDQPLELAQVAEKRDVSHGMERVEVRSATGNSHLGHLFPDGPPTTGLRYCINSASLKFVPKERLVAEGYAEYLPQFDAGVETVVLAGGCFWGMEDLLRQVPGVLQTRAGYAGGELSSPHYTDVKTGRTGHAEAVQVVFDARKISLTELLVAHFFKMHDPTTINRQGNDVGTQYRSVIFASNETQKSAARAAIATIDASGQWKKPIVTQVQDAVPFWKAEAFHQDYLKKNPGGYTCHYYR